MVSEQTIHLSVSVYHGHGMVICWENILLYIQVVTVRVKYDVFSQLGLKNSCQFVHPQMFIRTRS